MLRGASRHLYYSNLEENGLSVNAHDLSFYTMYSTMQHIPQAPLCKIFQ